MARERDLTPQEPEESGVPKESPPDTQIEGASLLANQAKPRLAERGFNERQIDKWAQTYIAEESSGDVDSFIAWIDRQQRS